MSLTTNNCRLWQNLIVDLWQKLRSNCTLRRFVEITVFCWFSDQPAAHVRAAAQDVPRVQYPVVLHDDPHAVHRALHHTHRLHHHKVSSFPSFLIWNNERERERKEKLKLQNHFSHLTPKLNLCHKSLLARNFELKLFSVCFKMRSTGK